jgi:hypothetical protein
MEALHASTGLGRRRDAGWSAASTTHHCPALDVTSLLSSRRRSLTDWTHQMRRAPTTRAILLLLGLVAIALLGCQRSPDERNRLLAERFTRALDARSAAQAAALLAPDAEVYLPAAKVRLSAEDFVVYLDNLHKAQRTYHADSRAYLTPSGAGWLVSVVHHRENEPASLMSSLWMQADIDETGIRRVWLHVHADDLPAHGLNPRSYVAEAELRRMPVPTGWSGGRVEIVASAERADPYVQALVRLPDNAEAVPFAGAFLGGVCLVAGGLRRRRRVAPAPEPARGLLFARLRAARGLR